MITGKNAEAWLPKGLVFDLDGLVLDSERFYCRAWQKAAQELGFVLTEEVYARFIGIPNLEAERLLAQTMGPGFPLEDFSNRWHRHWESSFKSQRIPSKPGLEEIIGLLQHLGIPCAIATSSDGPDAWHCLQERVGFFTAIVSRDQVRQGKPAPDLFLEAASRMGVEPSFCLALEDSEIGLQSATAAGMKVILIPDMKPASEQAYRQALGVYSSLSEVRGWLESTVSLHTEGDPKPNGARLAQNE